MKIKSIRLTTDEVRATLDGRKTVTRRVVKPQPNGTFDQHWGGFYKDNEWILLKEPYRPGDILYVRETWRVGAWDIRRQMMAFDYADGTSGPLVYIADREMFMRLVDQSREDARKAKCIYNGVDFVWEKGKSPCRWRPSIHMPREAARIFLRVTDVRVERLQDMTDKDAIAEGIRIGIGGEPYFSCLDAFKAVWDSTIKPADRERYGWAVNPWVWVIEFERCDKPEEDA